MKHESRDKIHAEGNLICAPGSNLDLKDLEQRAQSEKGGWIPMERELTF